MQIKDQNNKVIYQGQWVQNIDDILHEIGVDAASVSIVMSVEESKALVRQSIYAKAGDMESLLGTTSDAVQLLLSYMSHLIVSLNSAQSLADVRKATTPLQAVALDITTSIQDGGLRLPYQLKGESVVINEIKTRATSVHDVLAANLGV